MNKKGLASYCIGILLIYIVIRYFLSHDYLEIVKRISLYDLLIALLITLLIFYISGVQYFYILKKFFNKGINPTDILLLPISMRLWAFIIPVKGGLLYSTAFLKFKYKIKVTEGFSISIYIYWVSLFLTGVIGLFFAIKNNMVLSLISFVSLLFLLSPLVIVISTLILKKIPIHNHPLLHNLQKGLSSTVHNIDSLWKDFKTTITILCITILHTLASILLYYWANIVFGLSLSILSIIILTLVMKLSIIFRFTPGNLGVEQLVSGGVVAILGGKAGDGVLISLFVTLTTVIIAFSLGTLSTLYNMKYFNADNLKTLLRSLKS